MRHCFVVLTALAVLSSAATATVHVVDQASGPYYSIQNGLNAAGNDDTVLVMPGTYTGVMNRNLDFGGNDIVLESSGGADVTIIDCQNADRAFVFNESEGAAAVVRGFTIRNGRYDGDSGGGILVFSCSPTLENLIIEDCASSGGGGAHFYQSHSNITNCVFRRNSAQQLGGGLTTYQSEIDVIGCLFEDNTAEGSGGAISNLNSWNYIRNCTFVGSSNFHIDFMSGGSVEIASSVISHGVSGGPIQWDGDGTLLTTQTVVFGNAGGDSLAGDHSNNLFGEHPLYCDPWSGIYTYCSNSPCLATNSSWLYDVGAYGEGCGDCSSPVEKQTWGSIKALYR